MYILVQLFFFHILERRIYQFLWIFKKLHYKTLGVDWWKIQSTPRKGASVSETISGDFLRGHRRFHRNGKNIGFYIKNIHETSI